VKKHLRQITTEIRAGKNIDLYITIVVCLMLTILDVVGVTDFSVLSAGILLALTLIAYGSLTNRHIQEQLRHSVETLSRRFGHPSSDEFFNLEYLPTDKLLEQDIQQAGDIFICGLMQFRTLLAHFSSFETALRSNKRLRFLLVDPEDLCAIEMTTRRAHVAKNANEAKRFTYDTLDQLKRLKRSVPEGCLEVKLMAYCPPYTLMLFDPDYDGGHMYVYLHPFQTPSRTRPGFGLKAEKDKTWFKYFYEQFEKIWAWEGTREWGFSELPSKQRE
jgi:hypothetical protein